MIEIGITGNIGGGKSTVSDYLIQKGYSVIDADKIVKEIYKDPEYIEKMIETFGQEIAVESNGSIELDKRKIFDIVFHDDQKLAILDKVVGPFFKKILNKEIEARQEEEIVFFDIPLLYEKNYQRFMDKVIMVYCDDEIRYRRASERDEKTVEQIQSVDHSQMSQEEKKELADFVLDNSTTISALHQQIEKTLQVIKEFVKQHEWQKK